MPSRRVLVAENGSSSFTAAGAAETRILHQVEELQALTPEWRTLYEDCQDPNVFVSPEWTLACVPSVAKPYLPYVVTIHEQGALQGVAPLRLERRCGFRVLQAIGGGWSPYAGFLCRDLPGEQQLLAALGGQTRKWDLLVLTGLAEPFSHLHRLPPPTGAWGGATSTRLPGSALLARSDSWETLLAEGPSWLRRMAKAHRKFTRAGGTVLRLRGAEAQVYMAEVARVESVSWQGQYGHSRSPRTWSSVRQLLEETLGSLGRSGEMELWLAQRDGHVVAYEINFLLPQRLWLYRGAYDPASARWSPGGILDFLSIRAAWQEGRREYDFLGGGEGYKRERTDSERELKQVVLAAATPRGALAYLCLRLPRAILNRSPECRRWLRVARRLAMNPRTIRSWQRKGRDRVH